MSFLDSNSFEKNIEVPEIQEDASLPDIIQNIAVVSDALEKCEKVLQHLAIAAWSPEFEEYMAHHVHLISRRTKLLKMLKKVEEKDKFEIKGTLSLSVLGKKKPNSAVIFKKIFGKKTGRIKQWEFLGAFFSILIGSMMHFIYEFSGNNKVVAIFGAVNESTWEHLKLAFWPTLIFAIIEWFEWGKDLRNFCLANFLKLISMPLIIIVLFYGWRAFLPDNFVWDILIFALAVILGYALSYKIIVGRKDYNFKMLWVVLILFLTVLYSLFTYFPPKTFLFRDPVNSGYGIEK